MAASRKRKVWLITAGAILLLLVAAAAALAILNPRITRYVEGPEFRAELEKQTAKGLHFPDSTFAPIRRTGFLSGASASFEAENGRKAMTEFDTHGIAGHFNPLGVFLRRWQIDDLHIERGEVGIQIYEPSPTPTPSKPWYHVFLPDRVYLKRVWSDDADITWRMRGEKGGIFDTRLRITPHGRDFEYRATGGTLRNALIPDLQFVRTHLLVTKTLFSVYDLELASGDGTIHGHGTAETRGDKAVDFKVRYERLPVREWLPAEWDGNFAGAATGHLHWTGHDFKLETAQLEGAVRIAGAAIGELDILNDIAAITNRSDLAQLNLSECAAEISWDKGKGTLKDMTIEEEGKFRIEGQLSVDGQSLSGTFQLGLARDYLGWLPDADEVFTRERGGYLWTTVNLSGTLDNPEQDLSPRVLEALTESPGAFLGAAFRALGAWLRGD